MPARPAADEIKGTSYSTPEGNKVEVEGVCKIGEDNIGCWSVDGSPNEALAKQIQASLEKQASQTSNWGASITIQYGKKNRVIVFKTTQIIGGPNQGYLSIESAGTDPFHGSAFFANLDDRAQIFRSGEPQIRHELRSVTEDPAVLLTTARIQYTIPVQEDKTIDCRAGASAPFGGETHTIVSIKEGGDERMRMINNPGQTIFKTWTVKVKSTRTSKHPVNVSLMALDASGKPIQWVDAKGNPVSNEDYRKQMMEDQKAMAEHMKNHPNEPYQPQSWGKYTSPNSYGSSSPDGSSSIFLRVNPAKVSKFKLQGQTSRFIDLTNIRLDPK